MRAEDRRVRCGNCDSEFRESRVVVDGTDSESCPVCHEQGGLTDNDMGVRAAILAHNPEARNIRNIGAGVRTAGAHYTNAAGTRDYYICLRLSDMSVMGESYRPRTEATEIPGAEGAR